MDKMKNLKRVLAVMLTLIMSAGFVFIGAPGNAYAASTKKLVSKVDCYTKVGKSWEKTGVIEFTYNKKGDLVKIHRSKDEYKNDSETTYSYVYTYKNGKKSKAKVYEKEGNKSKRLVEILTYDKSGRLKSVDDVDEYIYYDAYKYGKNGYITDIKGVDYDNSKFYYRWNGKLPESIITTKNGYSGMYRMSYFDKKGLITKTKCNNNLPDGDRSFKYSYKNGRVKTIVKAQTNLDKDDNTYKSSYYKYILRYTNKKIDNGEYRAMINYITCRSCHYTGTEWF